MATASAHPGDGSFFNANFTFLFTPKFVDNKTFKSDRNSAPVVLFCVCIRLFGSFSP